MSFCWCWLVFGAWCLGVYPPPPEPADEHGDRAGTQTVFPTRSSAQPRLPDLSTLQPEWFNTSGFSPAARTNTARRNAKSWTLDHKQDHGVGCAMSPDDRFVAVATSRSREIKVFKVKGAKEGAQVSFATGHSRPITSLDWSYDGKVRQHMCRTIRDCSRPMQSRAQTELRRQGDRFTSVDPANYAHSVPSRHTAAASGGTPGYLIRAMGSGTARGTPRTLQRVDFVGHIALYTSLYCLGARLGLGYEKKSIES